MGSDDEQESLCGNTSALTIASTTATKKKKKNKKKVKVAIALPNSPSSVSLVYDAEVRCVAGSALKAGTLAFIDSPFAFIITLKYVTTRCCVCRQSFDKITPTMCVCQLSYYCSQDCARLDLGHTAECTALSQCLDIAKTRDIDVDLIRLVLRLIANRSVITMDDSYDNVSRVLSLPLSPGACWMQCMSLMHHRDRLIGSWINATTQAFQDIIKLIPEHVVRSEAGYGIPGAATNSLSADDLVTLACIIHINSYANDVHTLGLYPILARLNHSCRPNSYYSAPSVAMVSSCRESFGPASIQVRLIADVNAGDEIFSHYVDLTESGDMRRGMLMQSKFFLCICDRCKDPIDHLLGAFCCSDCGVDGVIIMGLADGSTTTKCNLCRHSFAHSDIMRYLSTVSNRLVEASQNPETACLKLESFFTECEAVARSHGKSTKSGPEIRLHPYHSTLFSALVPLLNAYLRQKNFYGAAKICRKIIEHFDRCLGVNWGETAAFLEQLSDSLTNLVSSRSFNRPQQFLAEARAAKARCDHIRRVVLGM